MLAELSKQPPIHRYTLAGQLLLLLPNRYFSLLQINFTCDWVSCHLTVVCIYSTLWTFDWWNVCVRVICLFICVCLLACLPRSSLFACNFFMLVLLFCCTEQIAFWGVTGFGEWYNSLRLLTLVLLTSVAVLSKYVKLNIHGKKKSCCFYSNLLAACKLLYEKTQYVTVNSKETLV